MGGGGSHTLARVLPGTHVHVRECPNKPINRPVVHERQTLPPRPTHVPRTHVGKGKIRLPRAMKQETRPPHPTPVTALSTLLLPLPPLHRGPMR